MTRAILAWLAARWKHRPRTRDEWACVLSLSGHQGMVQGAGGEMFLRCRRCLRRTDGWALTYPVTPRRYDGDPERHRMKADDVVVVYIGGRRVDAQALPFEVVDAAGPDGFRQLVAILNDAEHLMTPDELRQLTPEDLGRLDLDDDTKH